VNDVTVSISRNEYTVPIGINNASLALALCNQPLDSGEGAEFTAYVIPGNCETVEYTGRQLKHYEKDFFD
jgi:hypothetical protein